MPLLLVVLLLGSVSLAYGDVPAGWFPCVISELDPQSPIAAGLNRAPAGAEGFVTVRDGHFVDGKGRRLRLLGTNVTFASAFPDKAMAPRIARRMASLGMNVVRFHHMDNAPRPRGIWDPAYPDRLHMDAEQLDRLDWFIAQLKQQGIYVNLNLHVSRELGPAEGLADATSFSKYNKGIDNFSARMIELQKDYARDLLTHTNPYTKTTYAAEPAVIMVEMNNENSLLAFALSGSLGKLPEAYRAELDGLWHQWLKEQYGSTEGLRAAWHEGSQPPGDELLKNHDLSGGTAHWVLESKHPGEDVLEVVDDPVAGKALHARLVKLGVNPWDFQVHQIGHDLQDGQIYTLRFRIKAEPARQVYVNARWDVADWRSVGLSQAIEADGQWREFSFPFRARDLNPGHTRISFNCQNQLGDVWIAGVSLKPGGIVGLPAGQTLEAANVPFPTASSTDRAQRDWMAFIIELERRYTQGMYKYLKGELGVRAQVVDTQGSYGGLGGAWRESRLDYVDNHAYWQHPSFPGRPWDPVNWLIGNSPMSDVPGRDTLTGLARGRVAGKPYTISEYDHPAPSDYRAEGLPMLAAFAGLQDWDGLFQFDYGSTPTDWSAARVNGFFQMVSDPAVLAFMPVAANLFRRGDVRPARRLATLQVPEQDLTALMVRWGTNPHGLWEHAGLPRLAALQHRVALQWAKTGQLTASKVSIENEKALVSDTGEISWRETEPGRWVFAADAPATKLAAGRLAGQELRWDAMTVRATPGATGHATVALTSLDGQPLAQSRRMLLAAAARVENQGMGWDEQRRTIGNKWGAGPTIAEQVTLECAAGRDLKVTPLDGTGMPLEAAPVQQGRQFTLRAPALWYLIEAR